MANASARDLCRFIDGSPSPFHVCRTVAGELEAEGFTRVDEREAWPESGAHYLVRGGSLIAWSTDPAAEPSDGFRIVGGHTDSPNLRVKQHHDLDQLGLDVVALEPAMSSSTSTSPCFAFRNSRSTSPKSAKR
jgi:aspartyl aminopeptidase